MPPHAPSRHAWIGLLRAAPSPPRPTARERRAVRYRKPFFYVAFAEGDRAHVQDVLLVAPGRKFWVGAAAPGGETVAAISGSCAVIAFCSARAFVDHRVFYELSLARRFRKPIIPVVLEKVRAPAEVRRILARAGAIDIRAGDWPARFRAALNVVKPLPGGAPPMLVAPVSTIG